MEGRGFFSSPSVRSVRSVSTISEMEEGASTISEMEEGASTISEIEGLPPIPAAPLEVNIYVAVKAEAKEGKANLLWAIANVERGRTIVLAHVLQPAKKIPTLLGKLPVDAVSPEEVKAYWKFQRDKALKNLDDYITICAQQKVRAEKVLIENNDIASGLVELITQHRIAILVMGAAADKQYSKKLKHLKSKTAISVRQQADPSCHILFVCKGHLIFSREASSDAFQSAQSPILSSNSPSSQHSRSSRNNEPITPEENPAQEITRYYSFGSQGNVVMPHAAMGSRQIAPGSIHDIWEGTTRSSQSSDLLSSPNDEILNEFSTLTLPKDEESEVGSILVRSVQQSEDDFRFASPIHEEDLDLDVNIYIKLQEALREAESLKNEAYDESCRRRKAEMDALLAMRKAKASETQYHQEVRQRKEIQETLTREKMEVQKIKEQHDEISEQLNEAIAQKLELELRIAESDQAAKDFEDKLSKARSLLHSLQMDFDALQQERDAAVKEAEGLRQTREMVAGTSGDLSSEFSFLELEQATENFNPLRMIGEGGFGRVYKGFLRNTVVAIKMLHAHSLQGQSEFDQEVSVLSRVRHPNLVTLIGACREASALVYEFLPNGSLEDRLSCLNDSAPLTWQVRTRIISEVCSALIFLHSNKPHPVVHGDLKPDNILLDANFVSKLGDFGICRLLVPSKTSTNLYRNTHPKGTFAYIDPEFLTTGEITPHSDIYSFGIIILRLLTGKSALAIAREVQNALDNGYFHAIIDPSAGDWPFIQAKQLAHLGLRCSEMGRKNRPTLSEAWRIVDPLTKAASLSASPASFRSVSDDNSRIPSYFICPIFQEIMRDPQIAGDGFTYEAEAIRGWIDSGHDTSPMTNLKLPHCDLIPNLALRSAIQEWYQQHRT